jgi:DNA-directed RNA polymerase specialized sigma24 family protein
MPHNIEHLVQGLGVGPGCGRPLTGSPALLIVPQASVEDTLKLVQRVLGGDLAAWTSLEAALDPLIVRMVRRHRDMRRKGLAEHVDDVSEVRTGVLERLAAHNFQSLRTFAERKVEQERADSFEGWLYGVVDFATRDHLRKRFGRAPKVPAAQGGGVQPSKRDLPSQAGRLDLEPERNLLSAAGVTTRFTLADVLAFIDESFAPDEVKAVRLYYLEGQGYTEIASALALPEPKQAEQLIRRLNARLRDRFAPEG